MFDKLNEIINKVKNLSNSLDKYKKDAIITSLPVLTCVNRAKKLIEENKPDEAEKILKQAIEMPHNEALVYKYLGVIYEQREQYELAVENYQTAAELSPHDKTIWQKLGFALIKYGKYERAEKSFDNANKIQAGNTNTFTGWGMALMKQNKYEEAHEKFAEASKISKYNFTALFLCAVMEINLKMYDKAEMKLAFLANAAPNAHNVYEFARLKYLKKNYDSAIHYAKKALDFKADMLSPYILLGQVYAEKFDIENSLKYFSDAEEKQFSDLNLYFEWGKVLVRFQKFEDAKIKLLKAYEIDPENLEVIANLGLCCVERKEFNEAKPFLKKVSEKEPDNKIVKQALGIIAYENNDIDEAINILRADDDNPVNCFYLAKCYEKLKNDTKVKDYYNAALILNPKYLNAYRDYACYLQEKCEYAEAQRKLRKALKIDENNIDLLNLMFYVSYILVKENVCEYNVKETIKIAEKIENSNPELFKYPEQKAELLKLLSVG